jgi:outer membrane murein-binding lipoprotein Lpp
MANSPSPEDRIRKLEGKVRELQRKVDAVIEHTPGAREAVEAVEGAHQAEAQARTDDISERMSDLHRRRRP